VTERAVLEMHALPAMGLTFIKIWERIPERPRAALRLLGGFEVTRSDTTLLQSPRLRKVHQMLVAVALMQPDGMTRGQLASMLWPDSSPRAARDSLRVLLRQLPEFQTQFDCHAPLLLEENDVIRLNRLEVVCDLPEVFHVFALIGRLAREGHSAAAGQIALTSTKWMFGPDEQTRGPVPEHLFADLPQLEDSVFRMEIELGGLVAAAAAAYRAQDCVPEAMAVLRAGVKVGSRSAALSWTAMREMLRLAHEHEAREVYEQHYLRLSPEPLSWAAVRDLCHKTLMVAPGAGQPIVSPRSAAASSR
jgi:hypothetical protein